MTNNEIKSRIEQLLTLYYLSREVMERDWDENRGILYDLKTDKGLCYASDQLFDDADFPKQLSRDDYGYWWKPPDWVFEAPSQRRAIEVRIKFLEKELNRLHLPKAPK